MAWQDDFQREDVVDLATGTSKRKTSRLKRTAAMYVAMVAVSTCTIFLLEHVSLASAFRTAMVAAVGKTIAANWVASLFD